MKIFVPETKTYLEKLRSDSHFRSLVIAALGGCWNLIYALYHLVLAGCFRSFWFFTMGVYYLTVCGMRADALRLSRTRRAGYESRAVKINSVLMFFLAMIFSGVVCMMIAESRNSVYNIVVALSMAIYTFYCVVTSIRNIIRVKKAKNIQAIMLRNTSMVYALGSLFGLECMMLGTFGDPADSFTRVMEISSGAVIFIIIASFAVNLLMLSRRMRSAGRSETEREAEYD